MSLHGSDTAAMRYTLGPFGFLAALCLLGVSAAMNFRFGVTLGKTPEDGQIYGWASVASDVFKAITPFFFFAAWRSRAWAVAFAAALVWIVTTGYALTGALGHSLLNRMETTSKRTLAAEVHGDLRTDKKRFEEQLKWIPAATKPADTVKAEIEAHKAKGLLLWNYSSECTQPEGAGQRKFCAEYSKLNAEFSSAKTAADLNTKIDDISRKLSGTKIDAMGESDPQAGTIAKVLRVDLSSVQFGFALLIVALLEFGSGFGPYVALSYMFGLSRRQDEITAAASTPLPPKAAETPAAGDTAVPLMIALQPVPTEDPPSPAVPDPVPARSMIPGAEQSLIDVGFPVDGPRVGNAPKRSDKEAATAFLAWLRAYDLVDQKSLTDPDMKQLYAEFCTADGRETAAHEDLMRGQLKNLRGVTKSKPRIRDDDHQQGFRKANRWTITPGRYPRPTPSKSQEGGTVVALRPLAVAPSEALPGAWRKVA